LGVWILSNGLFTDFVLSDLNYRVDIPDPELRRLLAEKEWDGRLEVIFRYDQVNRLAVLFDP